jgi:hypothetical protein
VGEDDDALGLSGHGQETGKELPVDGYLNLRAGGDSMLRLGRQQSVDLVVAGLPEIGIPLTDRPESEGKLQCHDLIRFFPKSISGVARRHGYGQDEACGFPFAKNPQRGASRIPGGQAIIDHDDGSSEDGHRLPVAAVGDYPPVELLALSSFDRGEFGLRDAEQVDQLLVKSPDPIFADRSDAEFGTAGCSEFSDDYDIERGTE